MYTNMSEEEAVARLEKVKTNLYFQERGRTHYVGICDAIFYLYKGTPRFDKFTMKVLDKINDDVLMSNLNGNTSYAYLFPLTEEGYKKRLAYIDDLIANVEVYI